MHIEWVGFVRLQVVLQVGQLQRGQERSFDMAVHAMGDTRHISASCVSATHDPSARNICATWREVNLRNGGGSVEPLAKTMVSTVSPRVSKLALPRFTGGALSYNADRRASPGCNNFRSHKLPHPHVAPKHTYNPRRDRFVVSLPLQ